MSLLKPSSPEELKRFKEWTAWLKAFKLERARQGKPVKYIPNAAWLLNDLYWRIAKQYLRPILKTQDEHDEMHKIHPYKIISASEIVIMMVQPVEADTADQKKKESALLAWYVANQILEGWNVGTNPLITAKQIKIAAEYKELIDDNRSYPQSFAAEHIEWLFLLNVAIEKPILINAQCWRMFYLTCLSLANKGKLK